MNRCDGSDLEASALDGVVQKGFVLVIVSGDFFGVKGDVGTHEVGEFDDLEVVPLCFEVRRDQTENVAVRNGGGGHGEFGRGETRGEKRQQGRGQNLLFHVKCSLKCSYVRFPNYNRASE